MKYSTFFTQTSTAPPSMHHKIYQTQKLFFPIQPTSKIEKSHVELQNNSIAHHINQPYQWFHRIHEDHKPQLHIFVLQHHKIPVEAHIKIRLPSNTRLWLPQTTWLLLQESGKYIQSCVFNCILKFMTKNNHLTVIFGWPISPKKSAEAMLMTSLPSTTVWGPAAL